MNMNLFDFIDDPVQLLLQSYPFWQVFVFGINMTLLSCDPWYHDSTIDKYLPNPNCSYTKNQTHLNIATYLDNVNKFRIN